MRNLAPEILRQRLLIEGRYTVDVDRARVASCLTGLAEHLQLRTYGEAIIHAPEGMGKEENAGFDAFIPLIDSGISLYVWTSARFFSLVLFTCKEFDAEAAVRFAQDFFEATAIESSAF